MPKKAGIGGGCLADRLIARACEEPDLIISAVRVRAYFDGFNFYRGCKRAVKRLDSQPVWKWLNLAPWLEAVCGRHWPGCHVDKVYYFTAPVGARDTNPGAHDRQHIYLRALEATGVEVVRGKFRIDPVWRPLVLSPDDPRSQLPLRDRSVQVWLAREKGSDVNLASQLLVDYFTERQGFDATLVISNDSDLKAPVRALREREWPTGVLIPPSEAHTSDLWPQDLGPPHFGASIDIATMASHQLPPVVTSPRGRPIRNPWEKETPGR